MVWIKNYYLNSWVTKKYIDDEVFEFKNIVEAKLKYYHSVIQGPASALWCEVLGYCSRGGLLCLLPVIGLAIGPHPIATAVTIFKHVYTQKLNSQVKSEQLKLSKTDPSTCLVYYSTGSRQSPVYLITILEFILFFLYLNYDSSCILIMINMSSLL
jgi:hypothetical protein